MAGIYLHIPFCKQACHYCNFHFATSLRQKKEMVQAILREIELQAHYLEGEPLNSIYIGGGTPSLLDVEELNAIFHQIQNFHHIQKDAEITLEANPDDLQAAYLNELARTSVNRLSIGIQSFAEVDLKFMNRAHNAAEAAKCVHLAKAAGFHNLTIDLIYGSPTTSNEIWQQNIQQALDLGVQHLSCYCLTVEPQTAVEHFVKKGKVQAVDDDKANEQFEILMTELEANGFVHYEISNFAKAGFFAQHNSNYWLGVPYLGIGPSAHSFNGKSRQWNIAHNTKYLKALAKDEVPYEREVLDTEQRYNEYVLTRLRTIWGCERSTILAFGEPYWRHFQREISVFLKNGTVVKDGEVYRLSRSGKMMADGIAMELFWG